MMSVIGFLIILCPLVVFHEFGHYIFARLFGVKAEIFSIGFGPKLWSKQLGETELRVSAVPLGGYVKLLGEDRDAPLSEAESRRALHRQAPWKRFFIFVGGPLFNFILAILIFMSVLAIGEPQAANVIGRVVHGSAAEKAGLHSGDRVLLVQSKPVKRYEQIEGVIAESPGKPVSLQVRHLNGAIENVQVVPSAERGFSVYGEATDVGDVDGMMPMARGNTTGVSDPESIAAKAGIGTGDLIVEFAHQPVKDWEEIDRLYQLAPAGSPIEIRFLKNGAQGSAAERTASLQKSTKKSADAQTPAQAWGLYSSELFVDKTVAKSPAEAAGVQKGDRLVGVGSTDVQSFMQLRDLVQQTGEKLGRIPLRWERNGKIIAEEITPTRTQTKDPEMKTVTQYTVGVVPMLVMAEPETVVERILNPFTLLYKGTERVVTFTWRNLVSLGKMFTGEVSLGTLGGPILIGKIAGESLARGLVTFLSTMSILSIGLGVLNLFPVPVLDGGHIVLLALESLRGRPLTLRQMEIIQSVGLVLILALMGIVLKNDIARLASF
ncbi:MAG: RIP metalloprotease RseP [Oligoflexia bacterium]|nr:RIP metalloprotease RseP [Oligoflexia bacterium]